MSRSMKSCNENIFRKFYEYVFDLSDYGVDATFKRCIKTTDEDKKILKHAKIVGICVLSVNAFFVKAEFEERLYIISIGLNLRYVSDDAFNELDLNAGFASLVLGETSVRLLDNAKGEEIVDSVLYPGSNKDEILYIDFSKVVPYFPKIQAFICNSAIDSSVNIVNFAILFLLWNPKNLFLEFSKETLSSIEMLVVGFDSIFPIRQVLYALTSSKWEHAFLEIYRCIEFFYDDFIMHKIYVQSNSSVTYLNFAELYKQLPMLRPKEEAIIKLMFKTLNTNAQVITDYYASITKEKPDTSFAAGWVYGLRNCIVHCRKIDDREVPVSIDWDIVLRGLVEIVRGLNDIFKPLIKTNDV